MQEHLSDFRLSFLSRTGSLHTCCKLPATTTHASSRETCYAAVRDGMISVGMDADTAL